MTLTEEARYEKIICDTLRRDTLVAKREWIRAVGTYIGCLALWRRSRVHGTEIREAQHVMYERHREYEDLLGAYNHALTTFLCCHHEGHEDEVAIRPAKES